VIVLTCFQIVKEKYIQTGIFSSYAFFGDIYYILALLRAAFLLNLFFDAYLLLLKAML